MVDKAPPLILASRSAARQSMLRNAGIVFEIAVSDVDEDAIKHASPHLGPPGLALELARVKAQAVSKLNPGAWVLGADQTLDFNGGLVSKAPTLELARERLVQMRGQSHNLNAAAALVRGGSVIWSGVDTARMTMRRFSDDFLDAYLEQEGQILLSCVGSYRLEGLGAQLFETVEGDYFTVLGMPIWPTLEQLRLAGVIRT